MNVLFEELFLACCPPYDPQRVPPHLRGDPVRAYGQYTFEAGFKLAMGLAFTCLNPEDLHEMN